MAALAVAAAGAAALAVFQLARPPGHDVAQMLPLLERRGAWPHRHLMTLEAARRLELLGEIAASAGHACEPTQTRFLGLREHRGVPLAFHALSCRDDRAFVVVLAADERGSTHVLPCARARGAGLACFEDWERLPLPGGAGRMPGGD